MKIRARSAIELLANVLTIGACIAVGATLWRSSVAPKAQNPAPIFNVGEALSGINTATLGETRGVVVLAVRSSCHYCTESMPLLKEISASRLGHGAAVRLLAVSIEPESSLQSYLAGHGLRVDQIQRIDEGSRLARYTPYVAVLDAHTVVANSWVGRVDRAMLKDIRTTVDRVLR